MNYLKDKTDLEERLDSLLDRLRVDDENQKLIHCFLGPLRNKGPVYRFHYDHTLRVTFLCVQVAEFMHLDQKALLYAGLFHDIGKIQVPAETLGKDSGWTKRDAYIMRPHVMDGYRILRSKFDFTAQVILWHHRFQTNFYPKNLPQPLHMYSLGTKTVIQMFGRILSICDQFDALHRVNGDGSVKSGEEIREIMLKSNPDQEILIQELYDNGIFTTYTETLFDEVFV